MSARERIAVAAALAALVAWSFAVRWSVLAATPFPVGIDGYYYPLQLRSLLDTGHLLYPASPLTFWLAAPFAWATDPIVGAKLAAALGGALVAVPAYGVGARLGRGYPAGLVAAALAAASAGSTYQSIEYVKNGIGITVALAAVWLVLRACERPSRGRLIAAAVTVIAAALAHVMAAALVVAIGAPAALAGTRRWRWLLGGALVAAGALALALPQRVPTLHGLVSSTAHWSLPALTTRTFTLVLGYEAAIAGVLAIAAAVVLARNMIEQPPAERWASWACVALGALIALPWLDVADPQGLAFRLRIVAFVPMALCAGIVTRRIPAGHRTRAALIIALVFVVVPRDRHEGEIVAHPWMVSAAISLAGKIPDGDTLIVSERHVAYMAAWYARVPVSLRPERIARAHRWRLMTLDGFIGHDSPLEDALDAARADATVAPPLGLLARHRDGVVLVTEPTWEWLLAHLPASARDYYARWPTI